MDTESRQAAQLAIMEWMNRANRPGSGGNVKHYGDSTASDYTVAWLDAWSNACHTVHVFHTADAFNESDAIVEAMEMYRDAEGIDTDDDLEWMHGSVRTAPCVNWS